jgi:hypothetical protein
MLRIILLSAVLLVIAFVFACGGMASGGASPTETYKLLYKAVKSKNIEDIKKQLTKKSIEFGLMASQRNNTPGDKVYENGFTATTFSETLPTMRDERINGDMGALEVWNSKESHWEDLAFIKEDGAWKLAIGEMFAGTYKSPGPGRDLLEKQAANAAANSNVQSEPISNSNTPIPIANMGPAVSNKITHSKK